MSDRKISDLERLAGNIEETDFSETSLENKKAHKKLHEKDKESFKTRLFKGPVSKAVH